MAQWRPLHRRITQSDKVLELAQDHFALWLYTALLPHTDREGRLNANPAGLAGTIFEGYGYDPAEIERALTALADVGLIDLYRNGRNKHLLQYTKFEEMCKPDKREAKSELPGPDDAGSETIAGATTTPRKEATRTAPDAPDTTTTPPPEESAKSPRSREPLHEHEHEHEQRHEHKHSSTSELANLDPPQLEATPRGAKPEPPRYQAYVDAWNTNRGPLPRVQSLNSSRRGQIDKLRKELGDEALEVFTDAVKQVSTEQFWRERGFSMGNLLSGGKVLNHAEKWRSSDGLTDSDRRLADKAQRVADAIGGLT